MASGLAVAAAPGSVLGANERIRLGIIGAGDRGMRIDRFTADCRTVSERIYRASHLRSSPAPG